MPVSKEHVPSSKRKKDIMPLPYVISLGGVPLISARPWGHLFRQKRKSVRDSSVKVIQVIG